MNRPFSQPAGVKMAIPVTGIAAPFAVFITATHPSNEKT
jgi:hypothetical protein